MSKESATEFLLMVASDTALQEKLAVATDPDSFVKIAQESGCSFTAEELFAVINEQNNEELKDEALEAVVGGGLALSIARCRKPDHSKHASK
jgi:predicted ribosomally synthesized peptide with nif11-like leader